LAGRVKLRVRHVLSVLSPVVCAAVVWLWVRSYSTSDLVAYQPGRGTYSVWSERGEVCLRRVEGTRGTMERWRRESLPLGGWGRYEPPYSEERRAGGFWLESGKTTRDNLPFQAMIVPHWALAAAAIVPLGVAAARAVRGRRRLGRGCCPGCGYDLRASEGRCPECGLVTAGVAPAAREERT
jgi:hypothetical protein